MKNTRGALLAVISMAALIAGGCASNEAVKKEPVAAPTVSAEKVEAAKPAVPVTPAAPVAQAVPEAPVAPPAAPVVQAALAPVTIKPTEEAKPEIAVKTQVPINAFETVYFDFDKADLRQDARDVLSKNADILLKSMSGAKIQVEGHCDERGSAEYNLALGENRAKAAVKYLTTLGVKADTLSVISYGKEKPAVKGNDEAAWAKNRRAEFVVVK